MDEFTVYCSSNNWGTFNPTSHKVAQIPNGIGDINQYEMAVTSAHICLGFANLTDIAITMIKFDEDDELEIDRIEITLPDHRNGSLEALYNRLTEQIKNELVVGETEDAWVKYVLTY